MGNEGSGSLSQHIALTRVKGGGRQKVWVNFTYPSIPRAGQQHGTARGSRLHDVLVSGDGALLFGALVGGRLSRHI
jgi:hypothetical protein